MNLSGLSAFGAGVGPGFRNAEIGRADLGLRKQQVQQAELQTQDIINDRMALEALGRAFGVAPPNTPPPVGPGQASMPSAPTTSAGTAVTPPGGYFSGPPAVPPGTTPAAGPQALPTGPGGPPPAAGPAAGSAAPTGPAVAPAPLAAGTRPDMRAGMSAEQLARRIALTNPGIEKRPDLLVRAMVKGQALLAPDAKAELAGLQLQQKIDAAQAKIDLGQMTMQSRADMAEQANRFRMEIARLQQAGANDRQIQALTASASALMAKLASNEKTTGMKEEGKDRRLGLSLDNKQAIATAANDVKRELGDAKNLNDTKRIEATQWYQQRKTELEAQKLSDAAVKAQMDHDIKLIQEEGKNTRNTETVAGRGDVARVNADAKGDAQGVTQQFRAYAQQTAAINRKISEMLAGGKQLTDLKGPQRAAYEQLVVQRDSLAAKAKEIGDKAEKAGAAKLPKFSDVVKEEAAVPDAAPAPTPEMPAAPTPAVTPPAAPAVPPPTTPALPAAARAQLQEGTVTTFGNGQKWTLKDGQPEQVQ